jgi:RNA polymerase sigma-70 factor (ECF subfamily)
MRRDKNGETRLTQTGERPVPTLYSGTVLTGGPAFPETRWTMIVAAGKETPGREEALNALCGAYWYPVYAFIRRKGNGADEASDLTQEFFTRLLSGSFLERATPERGRFRAFLLNAVRFFLSDERDRATALRRGGNQLPFSLENAENRYLKEPSHDETPERIFERRWARAVLDRVLQVLRDDFVRHGRVDDFNQLKPYLVGQSEVPYATLAGRLGITESALKSGIHRFRKRYRDLLRAEVASTVADQSAVDAELRFLLNAITVNRAT